MTTKIELPRNILEKALNLRNSMRTIYIELFMASKPISADDIAKIVSHTRAYVNMRLNQLEDMGYIKHIHDGKTHDGKVKLYEVIQ